MNRSKQAGMDKKNIVALLVGLLSPQLLTRSRPK
jgi:hypothetical protein